MDRFVVFAQDFRPRVVNGVSVMPNHGQAGGAPAWLTLGDGTTATKFPTPLANGYGATFDGGDYVDCGSIDRYERTNQFSIYFFGRVGSAPNQWIANTVNAAADFKGIFIYTDAPNRFECNVCSAYTPGTRCARNTPNNLHASSYVFAYSGNAITSYTNGILSGTNVIAGLTSGTILTGKQMRLGARTDGSAGMIGQCWGFGVADGILTPSDIAKVDVLVKARMASASTAKKVFYAQTHVPSGATGHVTSSIDIDAATDVAAVTTAGQEIFDGTPIRHVLGNIKIGDTPKSIGCTAAGAIACAAPPGGSKRLSFIWVSSTIECGWCTVRGLATTTGQNGYWWRISAGQLQIVKSLAGVETVLATGGTITAGVEYELQFDWDAATGLLRLWYKPYGAASWTLGCSATDTDVTSTTLMCLSLIGTGNRITRKVSTYSVVVHPDRWGT